MKFSISSALLKAHLQIASGAIASNPIIPIMEDFLFQIRHNELSITATDSETTISTRLEIEADEEGSIAVPAKILVDTLKALPEQPITLDIDMETHVVLVTSTTGQYKLAGEPGDDFPELPVADDVDLIEVPSGMLLEGISKTLFATSTDELRRAMTGVYFEINSEGMTLVSTDAHRLVRYNFSDIQTDVSTSFIVPKKALNLLKNALSGNNSMVKVEFNESHAFFSFESQNILCRLIDERYPDYQAVIPANNPNVMGVTRSDLQNALKRIIHYANKTTNQVKLDITDGSLKIEAEDLDYSNKATEGLPCHYEGESMLIGFNAKFLIEMLGALDVDRINFEFSNPTQAGIIRPDEATDGEDLLMLVMPVMLNT